MNNCQPCPRCSPRCWLFCSLAVVYVVSFPEDLEGLLAPLRLLLSLTNDVAIGAYFLAAVVVVCLTWKRPRRRLPLTSGPSETSA